MWARLTHRQGWAALLAATARGYREWSAHAERWRLPEQIGQGGRRRRRRADVTQPRCPALPAILFVELFDKGRDNHWLGPWFADRGVPERAVVPDDEHQSPDLVSAVVGGCRYLGEVLRRSVPARWIHRRYTAPTWLMGRSPAAQLPSAKKRPRRHHLAVLPAVVQYQNGRA
jgi:hypothetical protein